MRAKHEWARMHEPPGDPPEDLEDAGSLEGQDGGADAAPPGDAIAAGQEWFRPHYEKIMRQKREAEEARAAEKARLEEELRQLNEADQADEAEVKELESAMEAPPQDCGDSRAETLRDAIRREIHRVISIWIMHFWCYPGNPQSYELKTYAGRTARFGNLKSLGTWGEAKNLFRETDRFTIRHLGRREWDEMFDQIMLLLEDVDKGTESRSELILADKLDQYLNNRVPIRLDSYRRARERLRDRSCPVKPMKGDPNGPMRIWFEIEDFLTWASLHSVGWEFDRKEITNDLRRLGVVPGRIHPGVNQIYKRDTTKSYWGLPPERWPVPENSLEPATPEELKEQFHDFNPDGPEKDLDCDDREYDD